MNETKKMDTVVIQIGNSDNRLGQKSWSKFIVETRAIIGKHCGQVHFDGGASFDSRWQNVCIVAEIQEIDKQPLSDDLSALRGTYYQDSIAITFGETVMV
jgi:hypothetical protein